MAASAADPPCSKIFAPVCDASALLVAQMPRCEMTIERP
jgi:hypothetical protein